MIPQQRRGNSYVFQEQLGVEIFIQSTDRNKNSQ